MKDNLSNSQPGRINPKPRDTEKRKKKKKKSFQNSRKMGSSEAEEGQEKGQEEKDHRGS